MTVLETKEKIEKELLAAKESFGEASYLVNHTVDVEVNHIEGAPVDVTYVFGSLSFGAPDASEDDRLYLPLDVELNDDDTVNEESFEENVALFNKRVGEIRERILASSDYEAEVKAIIEDFDRAVEEEYQREVERRRRAAKRDLLIATGAIAVAAVLALAIFIIQRLA